MFEGISVDAGMWGLGSSSRFTRHRFMVISFQESTFVYDFGDTGTQPIIVSDDASCPFAIDCETVHACMMFDGSATVQVRVAPDCPLPLLVPARMHAVWSCPAVSRVSHC
jgi:hypothetical protein